MISFEVRKKFLEFFKKNRHTVLPGSSLIPQNDPTLLFVNAGMNQFKDVFLGLTSPPAQNTVTIQKCLRAGGKHNDLEEVGKTPLHHTFFEMLGNFSFGGYFKKEAIDLAWRFLTQELKLLPDNLWITVHREDGESYRIWKDEQKIPERKIYRLDDKDNFWQMGDTGPCGYCSEIHYYSGKEEEPDPCQFMEVWNLVFMEFNRRPDGAKEKLPVPCVDTGMGLERLCALLQNKKSNYHTDLFLGIIQKLEKHCAFKYDFNEKQQTDQQRAFRVVADHSRAVSLLINDGITPGNDKEGYVLKRIMRRALYYNQKLKPKKNLLQVGAEQNISLMAEASQAFAREGFSQYRDYFDLQREKDRIQFHIKNEDDKFSSSLKEGKKRLEEEMSLSSQEKLITAKTVWNLYNTYGFPMDLTRLIAKERGWTVPSDRKIRDHIIMSSPKVKQYIEESKQELKPLNVLYKRGQRSIWQKNQEDSEKKKIIRDKINSLSEEDRITVWTAYETDVEKGKILSVLSPVSSAVSSDESIFKAETRSIAKPLFNSISQGSRGYVILDKTCFYPEGGGPIGDIGQIKTDTGTALVLDCQKQGDVIVHEVEVLEGELSEHQQAEIEVNKNFRKQIAISHTATHLLHSALRSVLGDTVRQAGSLVEPGRLRFDFTCPHPLTLKQKEQVEERVWQSLIREEDLSSSHRSFDRAKREGALFLQGENYGREKVRLIRIGDQTSKELCGGIHVQNTREIEDFQIVSEKGIQAGVRRIVAYTGVLAQIWEEFLIQQNLELRNYLKFPLLVYEKEKGFWRGQVEKDNPFLQWMGNQEKAIKALKKSIVHLENKKIKQSLSQKPDLIKVKSFVHPLTRQNLEFREHSKLPLPKEKSLKHYFLEQTKQSMKNQNHSNVPPAFKDFFEESKNPLDEIKTKERDAENLKNQYDKIQQMGLTKDKFKEQARNFQLSGQKGKLLVASIPLEDRKILSDLSDTLLSALSSGVLVLFGEGKGKHPVFVSLTKDFEKLLSAGDILKKTIARLCQGQGGGKASFAQGSVTDKSAVPDLSQKLLEQWSQYGK